MDIPSISTQASHIIDPQSQSSAQKSDNKSIKDSVHLNKNGVHVSGYNQKGQVSETAANIESKPSTQTLYQQIRKEIWSQAFTLLKAYSEKSDTASIFEEGMARILESGADPQDPIGLNAYYTTNPEDWEQVQRGEIPDYFNVENTGNRILNIWLGDSQGSGGSVEFLTRVKDFIDQAYGEVSGMLGELPQIVQDTQAFIEERLNELIAAAENTDGATQESSDIIDTMV